MDEKKKTFASKHPLLAEAAVTFPKKVFTQWLRHRRKSADIQWPKWRSVGQRDKRISILDWAAQLGAIRN